MSEDSLDVVTPDSWDVAERAPRGSKSSSAGSTKGGERRGSSEASRPSIVESRDSLQTDTAPQKNLRDKLKFDLTQPWQRSLLRDLEQIESAMEDDYGTHRRPRADRVLIGHTESGDYLMECEDDLSTATDSSSTVPTRLQLVHRNQFPTRRRFTSRDEYPEVVPDHSVDIRTASPKGVHDEVSLSLEHRMPLSKQKIQYLTHPRLDHTDGEGRLPTHCDLPYVGPRLSPAPVSSELYRANAFSEVEAIKPAKVWTTEEDPSVIDYTDPACMCMGYMSLIDLFLLTEPSSVRNKKRRTSQDTSRRASLDRVEEEEEEEEETMSGLNPFPCSPSHEKYLPRENVQAFQQVRDLELYEYHD